MLFLKLFIIFTKIGTFNFGGGYAMLSLIHNETVVKKQWLSNAEFTDIVAISQSTPGPIGINCATYVGYTSTLHAGYPEWAAILGAILASLSIMWLPFVIMILISRMPRTRFISLPPPRFWAQITAIRPPWSVLPIQRERHSSANASSSCEVTARSVPNP